jgi:hypothetical protein
MRTFRAVIASGIILAFVITAAPTVYARGGGGGGFGGGPHGAGPVTGAPTWQGSSPPGFSQGMKTGWRGGSVPPGWSKGKKTGWNGRGVPPGLYGR